MAPRLELYGRGFQGTYSARYEHNTKPVLTELRSVKQAISSR